MTDQPNRTARITTIVVAGAVAVAVGGAAFGVSRATAGDAPAPSATLTATPSVVASPAATTASPTPQPTATTGLQTAAPIDGTLTAKIVAMKALQAKATQPGQVGGPAVQFRIVLTNAGGSAVDLSNAIVNVYYGIDQEPAYQLDSDGVVFPTSVAAHAAVTGTVVFTIPTDERSTVQVTVDTSASTPVVAFTGAAPK